MSLSRVGAIKGLGDRLSVAADAGWQTALSRHGGTGMGVARAMGKHALKGTVVGGGIGGTLEAAQGGSFWAGAKEGAFNGGVGFAGYKYAASAYSKTGSGIKNTLTGVSAHLGATSKYRDTALGSMSQLSRSQRQQLEKSRVSKQVQAIDRVNRESKKTPSQM